MGALFEELASQETPMGLISLRRRVEPARGVDVYEVKLDDEFLMSSLFTTAEIELARLGLAEASGDQLDVVVGGLGLGYTARTVLDDDRVASLVVVEALGDVIEWHRRELLPDTAGLASDPRTQLVQGDFFAMTDSEAGLDPDAPGRRFDAVLVDIDHSPRHVLHPGHARFYLPGGLRAMAPPSAPRRGLRPVVRRPARRRLLRRPGAGVRRDGGARGQLRQLPHRWRVGQHRLPGKVAGGMKQGA